MEERIRSDMADLMAKEQAVLEAWAAQRRRFEECVKFVAVEVSCIPILSVNYTLPYQLLTIIL